MVTMPYYAYHEQWTNIGFIFTYRNGDKSEVINVSNAKKLIE